MERVRCPYCHCRVSAAEAENDDGSCSECGAPLTGSGLFADDDPYEEDEEDYLAMEEDDQDDFKAKRGRRKA